MKSVEEAIFALFEWFLSTSSKPEAERIKINERAIIYVEAFSYFPPYIVEKIVIDARERYVWLPAIAELTKPMKTNLILNFKRKFIDRVSKRSMPMSGEFNEKTNCYIKCFKDIETDEVGEMIERFSGGVRYFQGLDNYTFDKRISEAIGKYEESLTNKKLGKVARDDINSLRRPKENNSELTAVAA